MPKLEIQRVLVLSTVHISRADAAVLRQLSDHELVTGPVVYAYPEGYWIHMGDEMYEYEEVPQLSKAFYAAAKLAQKNGCQFLRLDCDGQVRANLPQFNW